MNFPCVIAFLLLMNGGFALSQKQTVAPCISETSAVQLRRCLFSARNSYRSSLAPPSRRATFVIYDAIPFALLDVNEKAQQVLLTLDGRSFFVL